MEIISTRRIRDALSKGSQEGYVLFPEIRHMENHRKVKDHPVVANIIEDIRKYAGEVAQKESPRITFDMLKAYETTGSRLVYEKPYFERRWQNSDPFKCL